MGEVSAETRLGLSESHVQCNCFGMGKNLYQRGGLGAKIEAKIKVLYRACMKTETEDNLLVLSGKWPVGTWKC